MTRYARAQGSKASNEKLPEEASSWAELKHQLIKSQETNTEEPYERYEETRNNNNTSLKRSSDSLWESSNVYFIDKTGNSSNKIKAKKNINETKKLSKLVSTSHFNESIQKESFADSTKNGCNYEEKKSEENFINLSKQESASEFIPVTPKDKKKKQNEKKSRKIKNVSGNSKKSNKKNKLLNENGCNIKNENNEGDDVPGFNDAEISSKIETQNLENKVSSKKRRQHVSEVTGAETGKFKKKKLRVSHDEDKGVNNTFTKNDMSNHNKCYRCGSSDHLKADCTEDIKDKCYRCGAEDHISTDCKAFSCFICNKKGHLAKYCWKNNMNYNYKQNRYDEKTIVIGGQEVEVSKFQGFEVRREDAVVLAKLRKEMKKKGIPKDKIEAALKLERRRAEHSLARQKKTVCYRCRMSGHNLAECPENGEETGTCFKCGSTEHTWKECKVVKTNSFKVAECFICKERGHIAKQCPDNPRGLYPKGGACKVCGDVTHLKKDCPKLIVEKESNVITIGKLQNESIEGLLEDTHTSVVTSDEKRKSKVVF